MSFNAHGDLCLGFWKRVYDQGVVTFPRDAHVLEIGSAEANWIGPMLADRADLIIQGIDWRACERPGAKSILRGSILDPDLECAGPFDAIVAVSTIEHIGLGSYENDPLDADGDTKTMQRCLEWLKPGGWMYLDVPYRPDGPYHVTGNYRGYDPEQLEKRLLIPGFTVTHREVVGERRGDGPYIALVLRKA